MLHKVSHQPQITKNCTGRKFLTWKFANINATEITMMNSHISVQVSVHHHTEISAIGNWSFRPHMFKIMLVFWSRFFSKKLKVTFSYWKWSWSSTLAWMRPQNNNSCSGFQVLTYLSDLGLRLYRRTVVIG